MLIDSHCHLHDNFPIPVEEAIAKSHANGVDKIIVIGTSPEDSVQACNFAQEHKEVSWTYGYHPEEYHGDKVRLEQELEETKKYLSQAKLVGIGEIGLDHHFPPTDKAAQIYLLENMLQIAQNMGLPVSFHVRDAFDDFWPIFDNFHLPTSVMHSFSDSKKNLAEALKRELFIGVNGLATFADIARPPLERIVLETDAPYLTPKPFRGKMNMPGYVRNVADWAAEFYHVDFGTVASITTKNAQDIFKI
jgi:TatD DNase family protein